MGSTLVGDIRHNIADISKVREALGFIPATDIERGLDAFARWVSAQPISPDLYDASLGELTKKGLYK